MESPVFMIELLTRLKLRSGRTGTRCRIQISLAFLLLFGAAYAIARYDSGQNAGFDAISPSILPSIGSVQAQGTIRWTAPTRVDDGPNASHQTQPVLHFSPNGRGHAIWLDGRHGDAQSIYSSVQELGATNWTPNRLVYQTAAPNRIIHISLALDGLGRLHALWIETSSADLDQDASGGLRMRIMHSIQARRGVTWGEALEVDAVNQRRSLGAIAASVDPYGTMHVVWEEHGHSSAKIIYNARTFDGAWIGARPLTAGSESSQGSPHIVSTQSGWTHVAWSDFAEDISRIKVSQLAPGSRRWTSPRTLDPGGERNMQSRPKLAAGPGSMATVLWLDDGQRGRLMAASLSSQQGATQSRLLYSATRGELLDLAASSAPYAGVFVVWTESRATAEGNRVYAGLINTDGVMSPPSRVDGSRRVDNAGEVSAGYDFRSTLHILWRAANGQEEADILHSTSSLGLEAFDPVIVKGRLEFMGRRFNCDMDGFALRSCDPDEPVLLVLGLEESLRASLGRYVQISGSMVTSSACEYLRAEQLEVAFSPCPIDTALVTGVVTIDGRPFEGARVQVGERWAWTGPSGRYYVDGLEFGDYEVLATADCALETAAGPFNLNRSVNELPTVDLTLGDIVRDCIIDLRDVVRIAGLYRSDSPPDPTCSDLDQDGQISIFDISRVAANYQLQCPLPWLPPAEDDLFAVAEDDRTREPKLQSAVHALTESDPRSTESAGHLYLDIESEQDISGLELKIFGTNDLRLTLSPFDPESDPSDWGQISSLGGSFLELHKQFDSETDVASLLAVVLPDEADQDRRTSSLRIDLGPVDSNDGRDPAWLSRLVEHVELLLSDAQGQRVEARFNVRWEASDPKIGPCIDMTYLPMLGAP